ncbi:MAG: hypothetical protein BV457_00140 [Thermoplasmata archaeon M9B1D]|nr:MAG: hypothetical protein BV457_00140 [Thermoplasmata archaeon M9B1D]PNX52226.1 MAG: hypothetical protein BV456_00155 [Thermoplasmata archaeon M8B2D]
MSEKKISELDSVVSVDYDDLVPTVTDLTPNGTKKITVGNLAKSMISQDSDNLLEDDTNGLIKADADNLISSDSDNLLEKSSVDQKLKADADNLISSDADNLLEKGTDEKLYVSQTVPDASTTVKGIIEIATNAEVIAGTDSSRAIVATALKSLFNGTSRASNGYMRLPVGIGAGFDEIIIQWGISATIATDSEVTVTLPLTFPNAIFNVQATGIQASYFTGSSTIYWDSAASSTSQIVLGNDSNGGGGALTASWIAIGY